LGFVFSADDKTATAKYGGDAFYQAKVYLEYLLDALVIGERDFEEVMDKTGLQYTAEILTPKRRARVIVDNKTIGVIGEFTHQARFGLKLPEFSAGFELDIEALSTVGAEIGDYHPLPRFPGTDHDITFKTPTTTSFAEVAKVFAANIHGKRLITTIKPIDIYQKYADSPTRNITLRLSLNNSDKTMSSEEINKIVDRAVEATEKKLSLERI